MLTNFHRKHRSLGGQMLFLILVVFVVLGTFTISTLDITINNTIINNKIYEY